MHTLETPRRFSDSRFWPLMIDYYQRKGIAAWSEREVPFQISSNPFIAHAYAQVIRGHLRDTANGVNGPLDPRGPVTVLELGAGTGQFGFLLARALRDAVARDEPGALPRFRYLMTDVAESNVRAWRTHPRLTPLVEAGLVEFAVLDAGAPAEARLAPSGKSLAAFIGGNPVVVIANYLFDVLVHDAFRVEHGVVHEVRVGLDLDQEPADVAGGRELFRTMRFRKESAPVQWPYYREPAFDGILEEYARVLKSATFLFPVVALRCLETLRRMAQGRLMLLVSDKARIEAAQLEGHKGLGFHETGSFSCVVNLDAVSRWTRRNGGSLLHPSPPSSHFDTYAFVLGQSLPGRELGRAFASHVERFGPAACWALASEVREKITTLNPRAMLALLKLGAFDPHTVTHMEKPLLEAAGAANEEERDAFIAALEKSWANYYPIGGSRRHDLAFALGRLFRRLGRPKRALESYRASLDEFGPHASTLRNMGGCYEELGDLDQALAHYRKARELRPDDPGLNQAVARLARAIPENENESPAQPMETTSR